MQDKAKTKLIALAEFCYDYGKDKYKLYNEHHLFFEYSPKFNCVKITVYLGGHCTDKEPDYSKWHSLDRYYDCIDAEDIKQEILSVLDLDKK